MVADSKQIVTVPEGADFICPTCGGRLTQTGSEPRRGISPLIPILILLLLGAGAYWFWSRSRTPETGPSNVSPVTARAVLRIHGSNTIGAELMPALAQEFLRSRGASDVKITPGKPDESEVQGTITGAVTAIEIQAHGSATAFQDLGAAHCDIGMASRKVKPDEAQSLSSLGDMTSAASEHVLGLDGIAVIVNPANGISSLTKDQLKQIFSGQITKWDQVLSSSGDIKVYARDDKSGTYDSFKTMVLGSSSLASSAQRVEDSRELANDVAGQPGAIGFVGLPYASAAKTVAVSETGARPLVPNRLTVSTEDYPLSRRLYLYTASNPQNPLTRQFIDWAMSKAGQDVVASKGFVEQNVTQEHVTLDANAPPDYKRLTVGADRLSLNFRFKTGSSDLDNKAQADIDRVAGFLGDLKYTGRNVLLFGFADSRGGPNINLPLSKNRAEAVSTRLQTRGIAPGTVIGLGSELPVASNDTDDGREKNRRVEIWLRK